MSARELDRLEVVRRVLERSLTQVKAAELMGLCVRQGVSTAANPVQSIARGLCLWGRQQRIGAPPLSPVLTPLATCAGRVRDRDRVPLSITNKAS